MLVNLSTIEPSLIPTPVGMQRQSRALYLWIPWKKLYPAATMLWTCTMNLSIVCQYSMERPVLQISVIASLSEYLRTITVWRCKNCTSLPGIFTVIFASRCRQQYVDSAFFVVHWWSITEPKESPSPAQTLPGFRFVPPLGPMASSNIRPLSPSVSTPLLLLPSLYRRREEATQSRGSSKP